jgi:alpha-glucosidase
MTQLKWWQKAVFYQIYPRSFADGNGDGIGDFRGMIDRLDYLQDLGIDAVWLSPHYPSPGSDCGYDVSDYTAVASEYGTLDEFTRFLDGAHQRGIRVILDFVMNHTSHQHPWFIESRSSRDSPQRDWYIWRDGKDGGPPNNWHSPFGGPAWDYDPATGQYYYHFFLKEQPDLNWRNPEVKGTMFDAARFWLDRGVDGFRLDAIGTIFEDPALPNHTVQLSQIELYGALRSAKSTAEQEVLWEHYEALYEHQVEQPGMHELMRELRAVVDEYPERVLVGENDDVAYYGSGRDELHLLFNFPLMRTERLTPDWVRANQEERLSALPPGAWPCNTLGNHDTERVYSHYGDGQNDAAIARLSLALMLTLRGTPFLYNGEEIGMTDLLLQDARQFRDPLGVWAYQLETETLGTPPLQAAVFAARFGRDKNRTPMQWSDAANAGFSPPGVQTWLPVSPDFARGVNVASQLADPGSLLSFYRRLLRVRKQTPALVAGDYTPLHRDTQDYLAFLRSVSPTVDDAECRANDRRWRASSQEARLRSVSPTVDDAECRASDRRWRASSQEARLRSSAGDRQTCLVVLNMSPRSLTLRFGLNADTARLVFSSRTGDGRTDNLARLRIAPFEVYVAELE